MTDTTHTIDLWLSNDQGLYCEAMEYARMAIAEGGTEQDCAIRLADWLEEMVNTTAQREVPELFDHGTFVLDLFTHALAETDWRALAYSWLENVEALT
jgi:hypothetical protein